MVLRIERGRPPPCSSKIPFFVKPSQVCHWRLACQPSRWVSAATLFLKTGPILFTMSMLRILFCGVIDRTPGAFTGKSFIESIDRMLKLFQIRFRLCLTSSASISVLLSRRIPIVPSFRSHPPHLFVWEPASFDLDRNLILLAARGLPKGPKALLAWGLPHRQVVTLRWILLCWSS